MRKSSVKALAAVVVLTVVLTQFNNCGNYSQPVASVGASSVVCETANCISANVQNLKILPIVGGEGTRIELLPGASEINVGGECNEGGFQANSVRWKLRKGLSQIRTSSSPVVVNGSPVASTHGVCNLGRFSIYVNLANLGAAPPYELDIEIIGIDSQGVYFSSRNALATINLVPVVLN